MQTRLPFSILCAAALVSVIVAPAGAFAQTTDSAPAIEIGPLVNAFAAVGDGYEATSFIGARTSVHVTPSVSADFDLRFSASSFTDGLYGMRLRFMPRADLSSWYLFGGAGGFFQLPDTRSIPAYGAASAFTYKRPGRMGTPMLLQGGAGARFARRGSWSASLEGEIWTSWYGGAAAGATFAVSYGRRRLDAR